MSKFNHKAPWQIGPFLYGLDTRMTLDYALLVKYADARMACSHNGAGAFVERRVLPVVQAELFLYLRYLDGVNR